MTSLPDLSIRQLEYLVAVADAPTWSVAAEHVGVSGSALSQGLAELERRVGVSLFERHGRRRVLRPTAQPVLDHARQIIALTRDLTDWADELGEGRRGRLRVGMIDAAAVIHFPDQLRRFRDGHPDVDLHLTVAPSSALLDQLARGELDIAVCAQPAETPPGTDIESLFEEPLVVCAPPDSATGSRTTLSEDPATWGPWVLFPPTSQTRASIVAQLHALGAPVRVVAESHQPEVLREMVHLGLGWTVLPEAQATTGPRPLTTHRTIGHRMLVLVRRTGAVVDPVVDDIAGLLRAVSSDG